MELLGMVSGVASILSAKQGGPDLRMSREEARSIAGPVSRLLQRRFDLRRDLNDARDGAGTAAGFISYVERVLTSPPASAAPREFTPAPDRPAPAPERTEPPAPAPAAAPSVPAPTRSGAQSREIGSGPVKDSILGGME